MKILRGGTENFSQYTVEQHRRYRIWKFTLFRETEVLQDIIEADEETGRVTQHIRDEHGFLLYTNSRDSIAMDNAVKTLMLLPEVRKEFYQAGYRPKVETRYLKNIRIIFRGAPTVVTEDTSGQGELAELPEMPVVGNFGQKKKKA